MPITIKDYYWNQNEATLFVNLPLKGTKSTNVDILNSQEYCKVSYPPFLFESWFYDRVNDDTCLATINNGMISLQFNKLNSKLWPQLFHPESENKDLMKQIRNDAIEFARQKTIRKAKEKAETINQNKKITLKEQMNLEEEDRLRIKNVKESERNKATCEIEKFREIQKTAFPLDNPSSDVALIPNKSPSGKNSVFNKTDKSKNIFQANDVPEQIEQKAKKTNETSAPDPRSSSVIQIKFTPRVFPTPLRESQETNESEWLQNQLDARKLNQLPEELAEFSNEEMNIDWLKDKANQFYKNGNFQASISVYSHAIRLFPKIPSLYSNRAACHFQVRNLIKCIEDCSKALELLNPPVEDNLQSRIKAHIRRGTAFCELELYPEGLTDYEAALKLDPNNTNIRTDAEKIRKTIQGNLTNND